MPSGEREEITRSQGKLEFDMWSSIAKSKNQILASGHHFLLPLCAKFKFYDGITCVYGW